MKEHMDFVWVLSNGKYWPRKLCGYHTDGQNKPKRNTITYKLPEAEYHLPLDVLAKMYPAPEIAREGIGEKALAPVQAGPEVSL